MRCGTLKTSRAHFGFGTYAMSSPDGLRQYLPRVLVVDDERVIADSLAMILCKAGYDARATYSGTMAIEMAQNFHPDLLITDVVMPDITGIETAIRMQGMFPSCKALLFSGNLATTGLLEKARIQNYEFELLSKPVHPAQLIAKLRGIMDI
jgi:CheY-like chemotaxis protein